MSFATQMRAPTAPPAILATGLLAALALGVIAKEAAAQSRPFYDPSSAPIASIAPQPSRGNVAVTQQQGSYNNASTTQSGHNNVAGTVQSGSGFGSSISQLGNYQTETHFQGETRLGVTRSGSSVGGNGSIGIQFELK